MIAGGGHTLVAPDSRPPTHAPTARRRVDGGTVDSRVATDATDAGPSDAPPLLPLLAGKTSVDATGTTPRTYCSMQTDSCYATRNRRTRGGMGQVPAAYTTFCLSLSLRTKVDKEQQEHEARQKGERPGGVAHATGIQFCGQLRPEWILAQYVSQAIRKSKQKSGREIARDSVRETLRKRPMPSDAAGHEQPCLWPMVGWVGWIY